VNTPSGISEVSVTSGFSDKMVLKMWRGGKNRWAFVDTTMNFSAPQIKENPEVAEW
jgi:hypothetical protein